MAALRKASAYSKHKTVPFTRISKRKNKAFIKTVPPQKIVKFTMGNTEIYRQGKLPHQLTIVTSEFAQIRHNALEACRQYVNKKIDKETGGQYLFRVIPFPHHIQRENKMLTGAGADRMQKGMQLSFGKSSGKAALVKKDSPVFFVAVSNPKSLSFARKTIGQIKAKLPCKIRIIYEEIKE